MNIWAVCFETTIVLSVITHLAEFNALLTCQKNMRIMSVIHFLIVLPPFLIQDFLQNYVIANVSFFPCLIFLIIKLMINSPQIYI